MSKQTEKNTICTDIVTESLTLFDVTYTGIWRFYAIWCMFHI